MKLLITTRADDGIKEMTAITHPIFKEYAKRVGADFMVLSHTPPSDSGDNRPHYRILKHYELHEEYDRILHLDSDMIMKPECPDIFKLVPYDKIATVLEDKGSRKPHRVNLMNQAQYKFGNVGWKSEYINTGILLTSKCHRDIFQSINGQYWTRFGSDDVLLGYQIKKHKFEIMELPYHFNHMTMFSEPWNNNADRFSSHIIHYGGNGVFDKGVKDKMTQMRSDYSRIYEGKLKILFVGVFDSDRRSTNTSQLLSFRRIGHEVVGYNYRQKASLLGELKRDEHLISIVQGGNYNLVVYSKCNQISYKAFVNNKKHSKTCLWFMDPLGTYNAEMRKKTALVDYFCCDKQNVLEEAIKINENSFHVCEGFDSDMDKPQNVPKEYDVSFIGNIYGDRAEWLKGIKTPVKVISSAYGRQHAVEVCKSKINLNFCTDSGASDRVYKILAAGGFLLTNDWKNREKDLTDGKECVIFTNQQDLNEKIEYYLNNFDEAQEIAANGLIASRKWNRLNWAKSIVEIYDKIK